MKSKKTLLSSATGKNARALFKALLLGLFALNRNVKAQNILAPLPPPPDQTPTVLQQASEMDVFASPETQTGPQPFKWEGLTLRPHPFYQFLYADGLLISTNQAVNTTIQTISAGALLEIGSHWTLDYTPVWTIYSNNQLQNSFGQAARLVGGTVYNDWVLGLLQSYTDSSSPSAETATQIRQVTYNTAVNASHALNSKMSLDLAVDQNFVSTDNFSSYKEWSTLDWLNYQFWPRLNAAVGVGGGYDQETAPSPDMTFEQIQARVNWRATDKISFQLHGGLEIRQFLSGGDGDLVNPVFDASIQYQPFEQTKISLTGQRVVASSYLQNQVTETTAISAGLNQRLFGKLFLDLNGGYQMVDYVSSAAPPVSNRTDNYYYLNARLSRTFLKRGTFAVFYQIGRDESSLAGYSFNSRQVGFQIGYSY